MTNTIFIIMMIFSYVVLYSLLGVIVAGGYHMIAAKLNNTQDIPLADDPSTIGMICIVWPAFLLIIILAVLVAAPITKLGELICSWFYVEKSSVVEKENE